MPMKAILTAKNADCQLNPSKLCLNIALSASKGCRNDLLLDLHLAAKVFVEKVKSGHNKHSDNKNVKGERIYGKL